MLVVVGLLTIVLFAFGFIFPPLGFLTLVLMLHIAILLNEIARIISGMKVIQLSKLARVSRNTYLATAKK